MSLSEDLEALETAEDFLTFFKVDADPRAVRIARLHILQRFHDQIEKEGGVTALDGADGFARGKAALERAYAEATSRDPEAKRVFKVHRLDAERKAATFVSLDAIAGL